MTETYPNDVTETYPNETTLAEGECMQRVGLLSVPGQLRLTNQRLVFTPNRFNQIFGLKSCSIQLDSIDSLSLVGIDRVLQIALGAENFKFHGKWARTIYERVVPTLNANTLEMRALMLERILIQTTAEYFPSAVVAVVGTITVSTRTVRFEPRDLERLVYRSSEMVVPLTDLSEVLLLGPRKLVLKGASELRFSSADAPKLYSTLTAIVQHLSTDASESEFFFDSWPAQHRGRLLARNGLLSLTNSGLQFVAKGTLGVRDGADDVFDWPFQEITGLRLDRRNNQLLISTRAQNHALTCADLDQRGEEILRRYAASDTGHLPFFVEKAQLSVANGSEGAWALLNEWAYRFPELDQQRLLLFGPVTLVSPKPGTRRGWCVLFEEVFIWLPRGGPDTGINPVEIELKELIRGDENPMAQDEINFRYRNRTVRLIATNGSLFTRPFWSIVNERRTELLGVVPNKSSALSQDASFGNPADRRETYRTILTHRRRRRTILAFETRSWQGELTNFSLHGCCVHLKEEVESKIPVMITIFERENTSVVFHGHIVHCRELVGRDIWVCGIEFDGIWREKDPIRSIWTRFQREEARETNWLDTGEFQRPTAAPPSVDESPEPTPSSDSEDPPSLD